MSDNKNHTLKKDADLVRGGKTEKDIHLHNELLFGYAWEVIRAKYIENPVFFWYNKHKFHERCEFAFD